MVVANNNHPQKRAKVLVFDGGVMADSGGVKVVVANNNHPWKRVYVLVLDGGGGGGLVEGDVVVVIGDGPLVFEGGSGR